LKPVIVGDSYDTVVGQPRRWGDRLALNSRWYFVAGILNIINRGRILCNKGVYGNEAWVQSSREVMQLIEGCGGRFQIRGISNVAASREPVVFISNHMSTLETFVLPCLIEPYRDVTFVVKDSLVVNPFFGPIMRSRDPVVVSRENPKEDFKIVMDKGRAILAGGRSIIIFPQSTRTTRFEPENFNTLGIKLAKAARVNVIPVAIKTDFWANGGLVKDFGPIHRNKTIHITFGESFPVEGSGKKEHQRTIDFIKANLDRWNQIQP